MTDIVKRLRGPLSLEDDFMIAQWPNEEPVQYDVLRSEAADEITRFRAQKAELVAALDEMQRSRDRYRQAWETEKARAALAEHGEK